MPQLKSWEKLPEHRKQNVTCLLVLGVFVALAACCAAGWIGLVAGWLSGR